MSASRTILHLINMHTCQCSSVKFHLLFTYMNTSLTRTVLDTYYLVIIVEVTNLEVIWGAAAIFPKLIDSNFQKKKSTTVLLLVDLPVNWRVKLLQIAS